MDSIGIKHELDKDEEVVIGDETPALLEIVQEGLFSRKSLLVDITGINEIESVYAMPYLTNKRILLWLLIISKKVGPIGKWWEMPIDFIRGVKFKGEKDSLSGIQIDYAVPTVEKSFGRQVLGMSRGKENFTVIFYTNALPIWKTNLTKLLFNFKKAKLEPIIEKSRLEIEKAEKDIEIIEKALIEGKLSESKYEELKGKLENKINVLKEDLAKNERELKEISI